MGSFNLGSSSGLQELVRETENQDAYTAREILERAITFEFYILPLNFRAKWTSSSLGLIRRKQFYVSLDIILISRILAENIGLPVTLYCPVKLGYISIGGITVNNVPMKDERQQKAKQQCDNQLKKNEKYRLKPHLMPANLNGTLTLAWRLLFKETQYTFFFYAAGPAD